MRGESPLANNPPGLPTRRLRSSCPEGDSLPVGLQQSAVPDEVVGLLHHGRHVEDVVNVDVGGLQLGGAGQRSRVRVEALE